MDTPILVTGGTGTLGRAVVSRLAERGSRPRVLSRRPRPVTDRSQHEWAVGDLTTGDGVADALSGVDIIVHCVANYSFNLMAPWTRGRTAQERATTATRNLLEIAPRFGGPHVIYISIVGIDRIPFGYYQAKLADEELIARSGLPYTILRATQFHDLIRLVFAGAAAVPVMLVPDCRLQPVATQDVAARLVELADTRPHGHVPDFGGPETRWAPELAESFTRATGQHRRIVPTRLPGRMFDAVRKGANLTNENNGESTFADYLAGLADPARLAYH